MIIPTHFLPVISSSVRPRNAGGSQKYRFFFLLLCLFLAAGNVIAQTTWNGSSGTNWATAGNWSAGVPDTNDDVTIPNTTNKPVIQSGTAAAARSVNLAAGASLTVNVSGSLSINGNATGVTFENAGTVINNGTIALGNLSQLGGSGFRNAGTITNNIGGVMTIDRVAPFTQGIYNITNGNVTNYGKMIFGSIGNAGTDAIWNTGNSTFNNSGCSALVAVYSNSDILGSTSFNNSGNVIINCSFSSHFNVNTGVIQNLGTAFIFVTTNNGVLTNEDGKIWTGCISSAWQTAGNWIDGVVPTGTDDVYIPNVANDPVLPAGTTSARTVFVDNDAVLNIPAGATLSLNGSTTLGLKNEGTVTNGGIISITSAGGTDAGVANAGTFNNSAGAEVRINWSGGYGVRNYPPGTFNNLGKTIIGNVSGGGNYGVSNSSIFNNNTGAELNIDRCTGQAIYNSFATATFNNAAKITIGALGSIGQYGIYNISLFNNNAGGDIKIDHATISGVNNLNISSNVGTFNNFAKLTIGATGSTGDYGIYNVTNFNNKPGGEINIDRSAANGINNNTNGYDGFSNEGRITIGALASVGFYGIWNSQIFANEACGEISMSAPLNNSSNYFSNAGLFRLNTTGAHTNSYLSNNGVLEYPQGNPLANVSNNDLALAPFSIPCTSYAPALQIGGANSFTVGATWYQNSNLTTSLGTYNQATNTFTWNSIPAPGNYRLYFTVTDNVNGCTRTASIFITKSVAQSVSVTCPSNSSVQISAPAFTLTGASPAGGIYSGPGVSGGVFNPASAGAGTHTITYNYTNASGCSGSCTFMITVTQNASCPSNITVCVSEPAFALSGGTPVGGTYSGPGVSGGMFNPATAGAGAHTITYTNGNSCNFSITVRGLPTTANAGPDQTGAVTCGLTQVTLAANTPTVGAGAWSVTSGTGGSFGNASSPTSTFSGTAGSTYTLRWTVSNAPCAASSNEMVVTFNRNPTTANAGSNQTGAATCGLTQVTLAANAPTVGSGAWSITSGTGGSFGNAASPTSTFSGTAGSTYTLRWTVSNSPCAASTDEMTVTFNRNPTTANAGPNQTGAATCGLTQVTLAANAPTVGTGAWSVTSGTGGSFGNAVSPTSTFSGTAGSTYTLRWTVSNSPCAASTDEMTVTFNQNPVVSCPSNSSVHISASAFALTGGSPAGGTYSGPGVSGGLFNPATAGAGTHTITYAYTNAAGCQGSCTFSFNVTTTVSCPTSSTVCISEPAFALTGGSPAGGTYSGPGVSGGTFNPATAGVGTHTITYANGGSCNFSIAVNGLPTTANAGPDQTGAATCGLTQVTLAANTPTVGAGAWSVTSGTGGSFGNASSPTSTFSGTAGSTYTLRWTVSNAPCAASTNEMVVTFNRNPTTANAGPNETGAATCGLTQVTLAANVPTVGAGAWSITSGTGGSFGNAASPTSTFSGTSGSTYTLRWTVSNSPCTASTDEMVVTFNRNPTTANADPNQTGVATCGVTQVTLAANAPTVGTGAWSITSGTGGSFGNAASPTSTFNGTAGSTYALRWTVSNSPCTASTDEMTVTFNQNPVVSCPANQAVHISAPAFALTGASPAGGTYSGPGVSGGLFDPATAGASTHTITYTYTNATGCQGSCTFSITVFTTVSCPTNSSVCISEPAFALSGSTPAGGTYSGPGVSSGTFNPATAGMGTHTITYTNGGFCNFFIMVNGFPTTANAGSDQTGAATCGSTQVTLAANIPTVGTGAWSVTSGTGGSFGNASSPTSTFSGAAGSTYTLRWTVSNNPCASSTDEMVVTFNRNPTTANAGSDQTGAATCGSTQVTLAANTPTVGTGAWSIVSGTGGSFGNAGSPTSTFSGTAGSTYTLRWTVSNSPCAASTDEMVVTFNRNPTTANAGPDQTGAATCGLTQVTLAANAPTVGAGAWSVTSGTGGSFGNATSPTSTFNGTAGSTYTVRWTISNAPCTASTDEMTVTFNQNPLVSCPANQTIHINAPAFALSGSSPAGGTYSGPGVSSGTFSPATAGSGSHTITYTYTNASGCQGSCTFSITVITAVSCPPAQTVCISEPAFALSGGTPAGGTYSGPGVSGGVFHPATAGTGVHSITYTNSGSCTYTVTVNGLPTTANAGPDQTGAATCGLTQVTLAANTPTLGTGAWSVVSGTGGSFGNAASPTSTFSGTAGSTYTLRWTISNAPCAASTDEVVVVFNRNPTTANAGLDQTLHIPCGFIWTTLSANTPAVGTGSWTIVSGAGGVIDIPNNPTSVFQGSGIGATYTLRWTISNASCTSSTDDMIVTVSPNQNPTVNCPANLTVNITTAPFTLGGSIPSGGTYRGSGVKFGMFHPATAGAGIHSIRYTYITPAGCPGFCLFTITVNAPTALIQAGNNGTGEVNTSDDTWIGSDERVITSNSAGAAIRPEVQLLQNRPNPFVGHTTIGFVLPEAYEVHLRVFDTAGRLLAERSGHYAAGAHDEEFDFNCAAGLLYYTLQTPSGTLTRRMMIAE